MAWLLFFDGDCGFCSKSVRRVYALDKKGEIHFAPLQGELAEKMGFTGYAAKDGGSMVLLRESDGTRFYKGDAWIELGKTLGGVWFTLATVFSLFPKEARNWVYDLVARNRYLLTGNGDACEMPDESLQKRMRS